MIDAFEDMRKAMLSYYAESAIEQLEPDPTRVELGIYDEVEQEVVEHEQEHEQGDRRAKEEAERVAEEVKEHIPQAKPKKTGKAPVNKGG